MVERLPQFGLIHGRSEKENLIGRAAQIPHDRSLGFTLDPLRDDANVHCCTKLHNGLDDDALGRTVGDIADKAPVDPDLCDGQTLQILQIGIAGAEIAE